MGMTLPVMLYIGIGKASAVAMSYHKQILRITLRMTVFGFLLDDTKK
jgi:hypothetical protein